MISARSNARCGRLSGLMPSSVRQEFEATIEAVNAGPDLGDRRVPDANVAEDAWPHLNPPQQETARPGATARGHGSGYPSWALSGRVRSEVETVLSRAHPGQQPLDITSR
jgi:hypothetical protein